jgi:hypothetical protein
MPEKNGGTGITINLHFFPRYTGTNTRLFECPFNSARTAGIFVYEQSATLSLGTTYKDYIEVQYEPDMPVHLTFVYEPIGTTKIPTRDKEGNILNIIDVGVAKIYLNGVCAVAKTFS